MASEEEVVLSYNARLAPAQVLLGTFVRWSVVVSITRNVQRYHNLITSSEVGSSPCHISHLVGGVRRSTENSLQPASQHSLTVPFLASKWCIDFHGPDHRRFADISNGHLYDRDASMLVGPSDNGVQGLDCSTSACETRGSRASSEMPMGMD